MKRRSHRLLPIFLLMFVVVAARARAFAEESPQSSASTESREPPESSASTDPPPSIELESDLSASPEFFYATNDARHPFLDGLLTIGTGVSTISDYHLTRFGARASVEIEEAHFSAGLAASYSPPQSRHTWFDVDPHATLSAERGRAAVSAALGVILRHIETPLSDGTRSVAGSKTIAVDQAQIHGELELTLAGATRLVLSGMGSFYDPPLAHLALSSADLGPAISVAGRPELVAGGLRVGQRFRDLVLIEVGLLGTDYADGHGQAAVPRAAVKLGSFSGLTLEASVELVVGVGAARSDPLRPIGGLNVQVER